jgi:hypothetical protein
VEELGDEVTVMLDGVQQGRDNPSDLRSRFSNPSSSEDYAVLVKVFEGVADSEKIWCDGFADICMRKVVRKRLCIAKDTCSEY